MVPQLYDIPNSERSEYEVNALRQVGIASALSLGWRRPAGPLPLL
jgi:hypothetical protein